MNKVLDKQKIVYQKTIDKTKKYMEAMNKKQEQYIAEKKIHEQDAEKLKSDMKQIQDQVNQARRSSTTVLKRQES